MMEVVETIRLSFVQGAAHRIVFATRIWWGMTVDGDGQPKVVLAEIGAPVYAVVLIPDHAKAYFPLGSIHDVELLQCASATQSIGLTVTITILTSPLADITWGGPPNGAFPGSGCVLALAFRNALEGGSLHEIPLQGQPADERDS